MIDPKKLKLKMTTELGDRPENISDEEWELKTSVYNSISDIVNGTDINAKIDLFVSARTCGLFEITDEEVQVNNDELNSILEELLAGGE